MSRDLEKLAKSFRRSWMDFSTCPGEQEALRRELLRDRRKLHSPALAQWAIGQVDALGRFEIGGTVVRRLMRRGLEVSPRLEREIRKRAKDTRLLPAMLGVVAEVSPAEAILGAR